MAKGILTGNERVIVQSRDINNNSVAVAFPMTITVGAGVKKERTMSRTYTFKDHITEMPLKMARILIKTEPGQFMILGAVDASDKKLLAEIEAINSKISSLTAEHKCSHCGKVFDLKSGLARHLQTKHKDEWVKEKVKSDFDKVDNQEKSGSSN